ncbi:hypothetical protein BDQ12DRAFT_617966, partial [Crucibulum laeve]
MSNYCYIHPAQTELITTLALTLTPKQIEQHTNICLRTVKHVLALWQRIGNVVNEPLRTGRPRVLNSYEISYIEGLIECKPDMLLKEINDKLLKAFGTDVSNQTISRA